MSLGFARKMWALDCPTLTVDATTLMYGLSGMITIPMPSFLIEHPKGLVLFDTGIAPEAITDPVGVYGQELADGLGIGGTPDQAVDKQIEALGYKTSDVTHVIASHFHFDHAGGTHLFPEAKHYHGAGRACLRALPGPDRRVLLHARPARAHPEVRLARGARLRPRPVRRRQPGAAVDARTHPRRAEPQGAARLADVPAHRRRRAPARRPRHGVPLPHRLGHPRRRCCRSSGSSGSRRPRRPPSGSPTTRTTGSRTSTRRTATSDMTILVDYRCRRLRDPRRALGTEPAPVGCRCASCGAESATALRSRRPLGRPAAAPDPPTSSTRTGPTLCQQYPQIPGLCHMSESAGRMWVAKATRNSRRGRPRAGTPGEGGRRQGADAGRRDHALAPRARLPGRACRIREVGAARGSAAVDCLGGLSVARSSVFITGSQIAEWWWTCGISGTTWWRGGRCRHARRAPVDRRDRVLRPATGGRRRGAGRRGADRPDLCAGVAALCQ